MCLTIYKPVGEKLKPSIAENDIVCYKLMDIHYNDDGEIVVETPYQGVSLQFGEKIMAKGEGECRKDLWDSDTEWDKYKIHGGFFHSYTNLEDVLEDLEGYGDGNIVFKAIIPAGTKYYKGDFGGTPCYASKYLIITREVCHTEVRRGWDDEEDEYADYIENNFDLVAG